MSEKTQSITTKIRHIWPTLLLEGLAVLLGVLLAFWVDSLGQDYEEQQRVKQHLKALKSELALNITQLEENIERNKTEVAGIEKGFKSTILPPEGVSPGAAEVLEIIRLIGPLVSIPIQRSAMDDILSSGGLILIKNEDIRLAILNYERTMELEYSRQLNGVDFWNNRLSPYYFEYANLSGFLVADDLGLSSPDPDIDRFVHSRQFSNLMAERRALIIRLQRVREELKQQALELSALIEPET